MVQIFDMPSFKKIPIASAQQREKLGEHHRRCAPDLLARHSESRRDNRLTLANPFAGDEPRRVQQIVDGHVDDARHLAVGRSERRPRADRGHDGMKTEAADGNVNGRKPAEHADIVKGKGDFLARLAQRRALEGFARLDDTSRQRDLAAVTSEAVAADGQQNVGVAVDRKHEQQSGGMAKARDVEPLGPFAAWTRCQPGVRARAGQVLLECCLEPADDVGKNHGQRALVIAAQLDCGAR